MRHGINCVFVELVCKWSTITPVNNPININQNISFFYIGREQNHAKLYKTKKKRWEKKTIKDEDGSWTASWECTNLGIFSILYFVLKIKIFPKKLCPIEHIIVNSKSSTTEVARVRVYWNQKKKKRKNQVEALHPR